MTQTTSLPRSARAIDQKACLAILNKRVTLKPQYVGADIKLYIQGTPQFLAKGHEYTANGVKRTNEFDRWIYNTTANSSLAMQKHKQLFVDAVKAESAGDTDTASDLFNQYLNKVQVSFSQINGQKLENGDAVTAAVSLAINAAGESAIVLDRVRYKAPTVVEASSFSVMDLIGA